jgi:hypothetical protein
MPLGGNMQRTAFSFALAVLSLLSSYAIAAKWPDVAAPAKTVVASTHSAVVAEEVKALAAGTVVVGLAD